MSSYTVGSIFLLILNCVILALADQDHHNDYGRIVSTVTDPRIIEASGLALSRRHQDVLYTHNDSGGKPQVYALEISSGQVLAVLKLRGHGVENCDWEDIAVGPSSKESSTSYIYIGDIGGNTISKCNRIYRVPEPELLSGNMEVAVEDSLKYSYHARNSETLMVDDTGTVWLVTKVYPVAHPFLFKIHPLAWSETGVIDLGSGWKMAVEFEAESPTGGDISVDGQWIIIKGYKKVVGYKLEEDQTIEELLVNSEGVILPYVEEKQGEAVCWDLDTQGYYTLSEGNNQSIWYYNNTMKYDSYEVPSQGNSFYPYMFGLLIVVLLSLNI